MCQSIPQANCSGDPTLLSNGLLYLRWLQAGVSLPVLRTHASEWGLPVMERRVWKFPSIVSTHMMDALRLRSALQPYTYTEMRRSYDSALAIVHPLYFAFPEAPEAYNSNLTGGPQHMFGSVLLASSIFDVDATAQRASDGLLGSSRPTWFPGGVFLNWNGTRAFAGPGLTEPLFYGLGDLPLFAPQGAVIPMKTNASVTAAFVDPLVVAVFPTLVGGASNASYTLYEDDGDSNDFESGAFATTPLAAAFAGRRHTLTVGAAQGKGFSGQGAERHLIAHFRGFAAEAGAAQPPSSVLVDGTPLGAGAPGCGAAAPGCFYLVAEADHSSLLPAGSLVVEAGSKSVAAGASFVVDL
jgi:alpha-glucosidase